MCGPGEADRGRRDFEATHVTDVGLIHVRPQTDASMPARRSATGTARVSGTIDWQVAPRAAAAGTANQATRSPVTVLYAAAQSLHNVSACSITVRMAASA